VPVRPVDGTERGGRCRAELVNRMKESSEAPV
jgi:hypothetical protein